MKYLKLFEDFTNNIISEKSPIVDIPIESNLEEIDSVDVTDEE